MTLHSLAATLSGMACLVVPCHAQCESEALLPWDSGPNANFGGAIDREGPLAVAGGGVAAGRGQVYVLEQERGAWTQRQILVDPDDLVYAWGSTFGADVAIWGEWIAVSEPTQPVLGVRSAGRVHLFRRGAGRWELVVSVYARNPQEFGRFGTRIAMDNGILAVSAEGDWEPGYGMFSWGSVYLFELAQGAWRETAKLGWTGNPSGHDGEFGADIDVDGDRLIVGTGGHGSFGEGARIFSRSSGSWKLEQIIKPPSSSTSGLGASVDLHADRAAIGASPFDSNVSGMAFVYDKVGSSWQKIAAVKPADTDVWHSYFGYSVALLGGALAVGAHGTDHGAVYLFGEVGGGWAQTHRLSAPWEYRSDDFGFALAAQDASLLVSAPSSYLSTDGAAGVVFDVAPPLFAVQFCTCTWAPCGDTSLTGGCVNSSGSSGVLSACGSGSVQDDDAVLRAAGLLPNARVVFFMGQPVSPKPFGAGMLCVANPMGERLAFPAAVTSQSGTAQLGPGIAEMTMELFDASAWIRAGDTWSFQAWYRDSTNSCGGGVNLTNGLTVEFQP